MLADRNKPVEIEIATGSQNDVLHVQNFCDAIRSGAKLNADALTGHLSTSLAHWANIATRVGPVARRSIREAEKVLGDDEANALVRREYRDHWGTPQERKSAARGREYLAGQCFPL